jgi:hypothetical protein
MVHYPSVRAAGVERCRRAGYDVATDTDGGRPAAVATPTADVTGLVDEPRPVAIEPLTEAEVGPEAVVPRLAAAVDAGQDCLFVTPAPDGADALARVVASVLATPTALAAAEPEGRRFYSGPDRVPLSDGSYACVRAPADRLQWREVAVGADRPRLELSAADEVVAVFEHVDALACPARESLRHAYSRTDGGQFAVTERGEVVDTFAGVTAMRRGGYTPVAMPLVPEHLFPDDGDPTRSWAVCSVADGSPLFTPDGERDAF